MPRVLEYSDVQFVPYRKIITARLDPSPAKIDDAIETVRSVPERDPHDRNKLLLALALFGRVDEAFQLLADPGFAPFIDPEILFRPEFARVRADPRFIGVAAQLGLVRYWRKSGNWPDFCTNEPLKYNCKTEMAKYPS